MRYLSHPPTVLATACVALMGASMLPARADDSVGVASCDKFLSTYQSCVVAKLPADQQAAVVATIKQTRANWQKVAAEADGKVKLDATCKETAEKLKREAAAMKCAW